jgi:hypothetical protein
MSSWILVGNPSATETAYVNIFIGNEQQETTYAIGPNDRITPQYLGKIGGPVRVVSTTGPGTPTALPIFTSERSLYASSFNEVMGYPADQFTTEYWYPWYDNQSMQTWVLVGNPSATETAYVEIYVGGVKQGSTHAIGPNDRITPTYAMSEGPVHVVSTTGAGTPTAIPVFTSERILYGPSFNEMMGYPGNKLALEYWFTWYDDHFMNTDLIIGTP